MNDTNLLINKINELSEKLEGKREDRFLTMKKACEFCGLSASSLYRGCSNGKLKFSKSSKHGRLLFRKSDLERWLQG